MSSFVCIALGVTRAAADEAPEAIHLRFEVEAALAKQCPDERRFIQLFRAEQPSLKLAPEGVRARTFHVRIRRDREVLTGEVVVTAVGRGSYTRTVQAPDCKTLTSALAVVAALASNVVPVERPREDDAPAALTTETRVEPKKETPPAETPSRRAEVHTSRREAVAPKRATWSAGAGAGTELVLGTLPRSAMGYRAYFDVHRAAGGGAVAGRASFAYAGAPLPGPSGLNVLVQTWTARLEGCASRRVWDVVSIEGCIGATSGIFQASSTAPGVHVVDVNPWLAFGLGARGRWRIAESIYAELYSNASAPTTTFDTVSRGTAAVVRYSVSPVVGEVGLGLAVSFGDP